MRYILMSRSTDNDKWDDIGYANTLSQLKELAQCWIMQYMAVDMERGLVADLNVTPRSCTLAGRWRKA
jgi:hypothetical protein